jgi:putative nucleotidyltransferase with HDIG domain
LNVTVLAVMLGRSLGLAPEELRQLGIGCLFHDIGKRDIPDRVRNKTEILNRAERNLMQQHPTYGVVMAEKLQLPAGAVSIVAQHHEFADGSGYPHGLKGVQIAPLARIAAIVNTYDDLCNQSGLHDPLTPFEALAQMFAQQRHHFDAAMLNQFIRCMGVYPPGTVVELSNAALGMVVSISSANPLRPTIVIYDPSIPPSEALIVDLESEPALSIKATLKPAQLPREVHDYLSPRKHATYFFSAGARQPSAR